MTTTEYEHNKVLANQTFDVVGTRPIRHDGVDKVTGRALYGADLQLADLLYGKLVRSPHAHARIISIDTSKAEAHPGVRAVATARDFVSSGPGDEPQQLGETLMTIAQEVTAGADMALKYLRDNVLASDKVLYRATRWPPLPPSTPTWPRRRWR